MSEAGKRALEWRQGQKVTTPIVEPENNNRMERKAQLKPIPESASLRHEAPIEDAPLTPAELVRQMRASRGQPL
jgi:hypothetical protein